MPRRRHSARLFLFGCLLALLALVGLLVVAFQLHSQQVAWESDKVSRQTVLGDLDGKIKKAKSEIKKIEDRRNESEDLAQSIRELNRKKVNLNTENEALQIIKSRLEANIAGLNQYKNDFDKKIDDLNKEQDRLDGVNQDLSGQRQRLQTQVERLKISQRDAHEKEGRARTNTQNTILKLKEVEKKLKSRVIILNDLEYKRGQIIELTGRIYEREDNLSEIKSDILSWRNQATNTHDDLDKVSTAEQN